MDYAWLTQSFRRNSIEFASQGDHDERYVYDRFCVLERVHVLSHDVFRLVVSDPIMFGHAIRVFFKDAFEKHGTVLDQIGANPNSGLAVIFDRVERAAKKGTLSKEQADQIKADFDACYENRPWLAMVNSDKGITNLHGTYD